MGKTYIQTIGLTAMSLLIVNIVFLAYFTDFFPQLSELVWVWKTFSVFVFIGGFLAFYEIITEKQVQNNLELLGLSFSALLVGTTNLIGKNLVPLNYLNLIGLFLAVTIASIQFIYFFKHWQYRRPHERIKVNSLKLAEPLQKTVLRRQTHGLTV
jgi:O-antigen/teichoic acid export membrane protein